jgi:hypothetical protein
MPPPDFILALFDALDPELLDGPKHPDAKLSLRAVVTLVLRQASTGGGPRAFSRWLMRDSLELFPQVPERTRLARLCKPPRRGTPACWRRPRGGVAPPALASSCSTHCGQGAARPREAKKGRAIIGGLWAAKWAASCTRGGCCAWAGTTATVHATPGPPLLA